MNFFRGLIDLLNLGSKLQGLDSSKDSKDSKSEDSAELLKAILGELRQVGRGLIGKQRSPFPDISKLSKLLAKIPPPPTKEREPVFQTISPPIKKRAPDQPPDPSKQFADAFKGLKPGDLQPVPAGEKKGFPPPPINFQISPPATKPPATADESSPEPRKRPQPEVFSGLGGVIGNFAKIVSEGTARLARAWGLLPDQPPEKKERPELPRPAETPDLAKTPTPADDRPDLPEVPQQIQPSTPAKQKTVPTKQKQRFAPGRKKSGQFQRKPGSAAGGKAGGFGKFLGKAGGVLAKIGKVAGPVGALATAAIAGAKAIFGFADGVNESNREISKYSGQLANAFAELDVGDLQRQIQLAQATEGSGSNVAREMNALKEDTQVMRETLVTFKNVFAIGGLKFLRIAWQFMETTNLGVQILQQIAQMIEDETRENDGVTVTQQAIRDLASGQWRNAGFPGLFPERDQDLDPRF